jgi:acyl-CoA synthetase (AMP-forming)/AMP-acid ligase II
MEFLKRPSLWLRALSVTGANTTWSPNFGFSLAAQRISERELQGVKLDHVRGFWNAAERIHLETMREFHRRFRDYGVTLRALKTNFGCAENVGGATFSDPHGDFVTERVSSRRLYDHGIAEPVGGVVGQENEDAVEIVSVGRPFPGMSIKIFSRNGRELTDGKVGEIALDTPSRMVGYLGDSRETNRAIKDGAVRTGDLGYKRGEEIFWVGRVKERINLHGKKFDPSDFEQALLEVGGLRKGCFAAFGVDDEKTGTQKLVIVSETTKKNPYPDDEIVKGIKEYVAQRVGIGVDEMVLLAHGTMSKTSSGKRRHRFYRQQYIDGKLQSLPGARLFAA